MVLEIERESLIQSSLFWPFFVDCHNLMRQISGWVAWARRKRWGPESGLLTLDTHLNRRLYRVHFEVATSKFELLSHNVRERMLWVWVIMLEKRSPGSAFVGDSSLESLKDLLSLERRLATSWRVSMCALIFYLYHHPSAVRVSLTLLGRYIKFKTWG